MVAVDHICVFFASAVSCEAISGSSVSSFCKCCKGTVTQTSHLAELDIFSCEAISRCSASSTCKCCKGAAGHGRLPVFYIVQTNFVNAQEKSWTGETDDRNHKAETHCNNAGVSRFATPRHLFTDNRSSGFCTAFRTVSSAIHWMILNARRVSRNATPFRDWIKFRTASPCGILFILSLLLHTFI